MEVFLRVVRDIALLLARVIAGVTLIAHGWQRWQIAGIDEQVAVIEAAGLPNPMLIAVLTIAFEIIGGALLVFGLGTPLIGLGMVVLNVTIIFTTRMGEGFFQNSGGWEYNAVQAAVGIILLAFGSGRAGVDHLFRRPPASDSDGLIGDPAS